MCMLWSHGSHGSTTASGVNSHAEGRTTIASGDKSGKKIFATAKLKPKFLVCFNTVEVPAAPAR